MAKTRKICTLLIALAMVLGLSVVAFAEDDGTTTEDNFGTVDIVVNIDSDQNGEADQTLTRTYNLVGDDTAESVIKGAFSEESGESSWSGSWLTSLMGYSSQPYVADPSCFDEYGFYVGTDSVLDRYAVEHGGVMMDGSALAPGYYFTNDYYTMYLGSDWTFQVDYANDGVDGRVTPGVVDDSAPDGFYQYTLGETELADGDILYLDYTFTPTFFLI